MKWLKNLFKIGMKTFPKDTSWMLNDDLSVNVKNVRRCREFAVLKETNQNRIFHNEGNVWNHTMLVCKEMHKIINDELSHLSNRDKRVLMIAALCHDLGKATTTYFDKNEKQWHCKNHGFEGEKITRDLLFDEPDIWFREEVCWLVRWHMSFHYLLQKGHKERYDELTRLAQGISTIQKLLWLNVADSLGSKSEHNSEELVEYRFNEIKDLAVANDCYTKRYKQFNSKGSFNMYLMIGVPGCGKDTYIENMLPTLENISRDDIREIIAYGDVKGRKLLLENSEEKNVTDIVNSRIKKCCEEKRSFVINQTNMKKKYRTELKETVLKYGKPNIIYVYIEAPSLDECKKRRGNGKWDGIIDRMWKSFEFPDKSECDNLIIYKQK